MKNEKIKSITPLGFPWKTQDPFLFCAYHLDMYPPGDADMGPNTSLEGRHIGQDFAGKDGWSMYHGSRTPGFPYHPHRGFETISIVKQGYVDHSDSLGASGRFGPGDVQWMTAGKGIQHAEMFPLLNEDKNNPLEMFQIWLNLPKASKFVEPYFKMLWSDAIPTIQVQDEHGRTATIDIIAGNIGSKTAPDPTPDSWAAKKENEVAVWTIRLEANAKWTLPVAGHEVNRDLHFYKGATLSIDGNAITVQHTISVSPNHDIVLEAGDQDVYLLMLQGKPINEPVAQHGPFVMNTREEIQQAFIDYRATQFGGWPWLNKEVVHKKEVGRFASHANGVVEEK